MVVRWARAVSPRLLRERFHEPSTPLKTLLSCDALLFDLDGILVDSAACIEESWRYWATKHRLDANVILGESHGRRALDTIRRVAPHLDAEAELNALVAIEAGRTTGVFEVPGARDLLLQLPRENWAVVTSGVRSVAEHRLRHVKLPIPDVMICADEVTRGKPDPEGYLAASKRLGFSPSQCVVVEDAPSGLLAARTAGMRTIAVASTHSPNELRGADVIVNALSAIALRINGVVRGVATLEVGVA
jgi:sugar-phosphatase